MTSSNYDTMIQTGNPNEYPEYTGKLFSELSVSSQEEYAFYSDLTLVEAQKDYDSFQRQEERMHEAELEARAEFENMAEYTRFNNWTKKREKIPWEECQRQSSRANKDTLICQTKIL